MTVMKKGPPNVNPLRRDSGKGEERQVGWPQEPHLLGPSSTSSSSSDLIKCHCLLALA